MIRGYQDGFCPRSARSAHELGANTDLLYGQCGLDGASIAASKHLMLSNHQQCSEALFDWNTNADRIP